MTDTALITGASAGIGEELARLHASRGGDLILVARREDRLQGLAHELRADHGVRVDVIAADLARNGAAKKLYAEVDRLGRDVGVLVNNAGFGAHGRFDETAIATQQRMMQLNMVALTELTHLVLQHMLARGAGRILNVGSVAGFIPGPLQAVYFASKAYVNSFSQALAAELHDTGVTVTVLCPGPVHTEFQSVSGMEGVRGFDYAASAASVARCGYRAMEKGELLAVNDRRIRLFLDGVLPFIPRRPLLWMSRKSMEKRPR